MAIEINNSSYESSDEETSAQTIKKKVMVSKKISKCKDREQQKKLNEEDQAEIQSRYVLRLDRIKERTIEEVRNVLQQWKQIVKTGIFNKHGKNIKVQATQAAQMIGIADKTLYDYKKQFNKAKKNEFPIEAYLKEKMGTMRKWNKDREKKNPKEIIQEDNTMIQITRKEEEKNPQEIIQEDNHNKKFQTFLQLFDTNQLSKVSQENQSIIEQNQTNSNSAHCDNFYHILESINKGQINKAPQNYLGNRINNIQSSDSIKLCNKYKNMDQTQGNQQTNNKSSFVVRNSEYSFKRSEIIYNNQQSNDHKSIFNNINSSNGTLNNNIPSQIQSHVLKKESIFLCDNLNNQFHSGSMYLNLKDSNSEMNINNLRYSK